MIKRGGFLVLLIFCLIIIPLAYSTEGENTNDPFAKSNNFQETFQNQIESGAPASGTAPTSADVQVAGSDVGIPSGSQVDFNGQDLTAKSDDTIKVDEGEVNNGEVTVTESTISVKEAESVSINNIDATGVEELNLLKTSDSFDVKHADAISIQSGESTTTLTNVDNLNYLNGNYDFDHADYIKTDDYEAFNINQFQSDAQKFTTTNADTLSSDCLEISSIQNAEFIIDSSKLFDKSSSIQMTDCLGNNITYEGEGALIASKTEPYSYSISKGTLTIPHEEYTEILSTNSTASATLNSLGLTMIEMQPTTDYAQVNKKLQDKDFKISVPTKFLLFIRRVNTESKPDISYCESCGAIDLADQFMSLKGKVTYSRRNILLQPVYESLDYSNQADFLLDINNVVIVQMHLTNEDPKEEILANIYNGEYMIYESLENEVVARMKFVDMHPYYINEYQGMFNTKHKPIIFKDGTLIFDPGSEFRTIIRSENQGKAMEYLTQDSLGYDSLFEECNAIAQKYFSSIDLLGWLNG